jgi:hypothetical protein
MEFKEGLKTEKYGQLTTELMGYFFELKLVKIKLRDSYEIKISCGNYLINLL